MVLQRLPGVSREDARAVVAEIERSGDPSRGVKPEDILFLPDVKFFRKRGLDEIIFKPYDTSGVLITEDGKPVSQENYNQYLSKVLPAKFVGSREFGKYLEEAAAR